MPLELTTEAWELVTDIHWQAKREVDYVKDIEKHGRPEHWAIPYDLEGDCEDFDLWCSEELIKAGIGWDHQAIAYCKTEAGGGHAVLLLRTDRGTYCLDNREDEVVSYDHLKARYTVIAMSQWGKPLDDPWVTIED